MKHFFLPAVLFISLAGSAQQKKTATPAKKPVTTAKKPAAAPASQFKSEKDSVSYILGVSVGRYYLDQGETDINTALLAKGIEDVLKNRKIAITDQQMNTLMTRYMTEKQEAKVRPTIEAGEKFLAANKKKPGVITTASGLQYEVIRMGTGPKPTAADNVTVNYAGTLLDGTEFDNSYRRGQPITFGLTQVISGWTEGLQLMPVGSKFKFYIPYQLGYGTHGQGAQIPGGSVLVFEIELLEIPGR